MTAPMTDDALIALAEHRFAQADSDGATHEDCRQLRDIFPAVLQRLREKVEITGDLVLIEQIDFGNPAQMKRLLAEADKGRCQNFASSECFNAERWSKRNVMLG